jgi:hypothetical protein
MGFFNSYQQRRVSLTGQESVDTLSYMQDHFQGGANWTQGAYHREDGSKCLIGAANHVRVSAIDDAKYWLRQAIAERTAGAITSIEAFNDTRDRQFGEIEQVIARAKQLAAAAQLPAPMPVRALPAPVLHGEILPPVRQALPAPQPMFEILPSNLRELEPVREARQAAEQVTRELKAISNTRRRSLIDWRD